MRIAGCLDWPRAETPINVSSVVFPHTSSHVFILGFKLSLSQGVCTLSSSDSCSVFTQGGDRGWCWVGGPLAVRRFAFGWKLFCRESTEHRQLLSEKSPWETLPSRPRVLLSRTINCAGGCDRRGCQGQSCTQQAFSFLQKHSEPLG